MAGYISSMSIDGIVDDCLWYIFDNLTFKEKLGAMRVNKRWRSAITEMLDYKQDYFELKLAEPYYCLDEKLEEAANFNGDNKNSSLNKEERVCLLRVLGEQGQLFERFKFDNVDTIYFTMSNKKGVRPLTAVHIQLLFKRLPSLSKLNFDRVKMDYYDDINIDEFFSWYQVEEITSRLKSIRFHKPQRSHWAQWVVNILNSDDNKLESLTATGLKSENQLYTNLHKVRSLHVPNLKSLVLERMILANLFAIIQDSKDLRFVKLSHLDMPQKHLDFDFFYKLAEYKRLKRVDISFDFRSYEDMRLNGQSVDHMSQIFKSGLNFGTKEDRNESLRVLKLTSAIMPPQILGKILKLFPSLTKLSLRAIDVFCDCVQKKQYWQDIPERCPECTRLFIQKIAALQSLAKLSLKGSGELILEANNKDEIKEALFSKFLAELFDEDKLKKLRELKFCFGKFFDGKLFEAFGKAARKVPSESFCVTLPEGRRLSKKLLVMKPSNLKVKNLSRCSSKRLFLEIDVDYSSDSDRSESSTSSHNSSFPTASSVSSISWDTELNTSDFDSEVYTDGEEEFELGGVVEIDLNNLDEVQFEF